jgi:hypothetical protein
VKKIVLFVVLLGAAFCLYAQEPGGGDEYLLERADPPYPPPSAGGGAEAETGEEKPRGFFGAALNYLDDPKVKTRHLDRKRIFELKLFDAGMQIGNNFAGIGDFLKKELVIDFDEADRRLGGKGGMLSAGYALNVMRFSVNPSSRWGGSLGVSSSGRFDVTVPGELFELIAEGNAGAPVSGGEFVVSGSAFYEIGFNVHGTLPVLNEKLTVGLTPAFYAPLFYIPRSSIKYTLDTDDKLLINAAGGFRAYTALNPSAEDLGSMFNSGGADLSLSAEYALFSRLDVGLALSRIPLVPARLDTGFNLAFAPKDGKPVMEITELAGASADINGPEITGTGNFTGLPAITVFRPLCFDFYAIYRPFRNDLLSLRPNIGFTVLTASGDPYLNMGICAALDLSRTFVLYLDSGLEEGLWRHKLGFELNLRAFELDIELGLRSQDYLASWTGRGLSAKAGIALGW